MSYSDSREVYSIQLACAALRGTTSHRNSGTFGKIVSKRIESMNVPDKIPSGRYFVEEFMSTILFT